MEKEEAISKIKKLLKLSESPNQHEAEVALKKARELMLQYHVTESSLDTQERNVIWKEVPLAKHWMDMFYSIIASNNRCECYVSTRHVRDDSGKRKLERKMHIVGYPFDVECVIVMAQLVEDTVKRGVLEFRRSVRGRGTWESTKGVTQNYVYGFRRGLQQAFKEQNEKQEFHLMCITPTEVKQEMGKIPDLKVKHEHVALCYSENQKRAYTQGRACGYETGLRKQIGEA